MSIIEQYNNELYHYGVKGMKWGVRRYQNEDGSLTPAGQKRLYKILNKYAKSKDRRDMLGTGVKEDRTLSEAAHKAKSAAGKHAKMVEKMNKLENAAEYAKNSKERNAALREYKNAFREYENSYKDYRDTTAKLAKEYLGKYTDTPLKNAKHVTAGEAFCTQVEWGIGMGWINPNSTIKKKLETSIGNEYQKKIQAAKTEDEQELLELEWMEKLDDLENYYLD